MSTVEQNQEKMFGCKDADTKLCKNGCKQVAVRYDKCAACLRDAERGAEASFHKFTLFSATNGGLKIDRY